MTVGGGGAVPRPAKVEVIADRGRAEVEVLPHQAAIVARSTVSVPNVSTSSENGRATPIA